MNEHELRALLHAIQRGDVSVEAGVAELRSPADQQASPTRQTEGQEFARIRELTTLFAGAHDHVQLGIGDDAAVLRPLAQPLVLTVDVAVEGVHFDRSFLGWSQVGARAMTAAVSDLAAMGARPLAALCSLVSPALPHADFVALHAGIAQAARDYACPVVGGNLASGSQLCLSTTVIGALAGPGLYRSGARAGDQIYVTGPLGSAALGLKFLQLGAAAGERAFAAGTLADAAHKLDVLPLAAAALSAPFLEAWRAPRARIQHGLSLSGSASSAIDVSDGALADLGHICEASQLGAFIEAERVPLAPGMADLARSLGEDPLQLALAGGEDYELIYTLPKGARDPCAGTRIGHMLATPGPVQVVDAQGAQLVLSQRGYQHFR